MGVHELVVGLNGAGKTLYTVSQKLRPLVGTTIPNGKGGEAPVRLVVGGIRELLLDHDLMEVPELDPEGYKDVWAHCERAPGSPAVQFVRVSSSTRQTRERDAPAGEWEVCDEDDDGAEPLVWSILNWWLWVEPGMVLVPDECQRVYRPMASGKRVPRFIARLETARHYGIRFVNITQHPNLIHANVRGLVGPIEDISRISGSSHTLVQTWNRNADFGKKALAVTRVWKHDKKAFGLYKSAELHTKFSQKLPSAVFVLAFALIGLVALAWFMKGRLAERFGPPVAAAKVQAPGALPTGGAAVPVNSQVAVHVNGRWPAYQAERVSALSEPLDGRGLQFEGGYSAGSERGAYFGLVIDGERVASLSLAQLVAMGYVWIESGPCVGILRWQDRQRYVTCGRAQAPQAREQPAARVDQVQPVPAQVPQA